MCRQSCLRRYDRNPPARFLLDIAIRRIPEARLRLVDSVFRSLDQFQQLRSLVVATRKRYLRWRFGIQLDSSVNISMSSRFVSRSKGAIKIGSQTYVTFKTLVLSYDLMTGTDRPVDIGERCFIGGGSMICPGVTIGDECIIAAGSVVYCDVPPRSLVAGNPARILKRDIRVGPYGRLEGADERSKTGGW